MDSQLFFRGSYAPVIVQSIFERNLDVNAVISTHYSDTAFLEHWHRLIGYVADMVSRWHEVGRYKFNGVVELTQQRGH